MRATLIAVAAAAVLLGLFALIATFAIRALRRFVRAVWPHS
jgi:hypothetical protein